MGRVVDQNIEPAELLDRASHDLLRPPSGHDIARDREGPDLPRHRFRAGPVADVDGHSGAPFDEPDGRGSAQTAGRTGHQRDTAREVLRIVGRHWDSGVGRANIPLRAGRRRGS